MGTGLIQKVELGVAQRIRLGVAFGQVVIQSVHDPGGGGIVRRPAVHHHTGAPGVGKGPEVGYLLSAYQQSTEFNSHSVKNFYKPLDLSLNLDIRTSAR